MVVAGHAFRLHESTESHDPASITYVLVHGVGMSHRYFARLHPEFPLGSRVISIDLPGFGGLPKPSQDLSVPEMGRMLGELVALIGAERVVYVGHSMGAQWVIEAARAHPSSIEGVVLIGPVVDSRHRTVAAQGAALAIDTLGESPSANAIVLSDYIRCGIPWYLRQTRQMLAFPTELAIRSLTMPVLVIRGSRDPVAGSEWCRTLSTSASLGTLVEVAGQHHNAQYTAPRAVAAAIEEWTSSVL